MERTFNQFIGLVLTQTENTLYYSLLRGININKINKELHECIDDYHARVSNWIAKFKRLSFKVENGFHDGNTFANTVVSYIASPNSTLEDVQYKPMVEDLFEELDGLLFERKYILEPMLENILENL